MAGSPAQRLRVGIDVGGTFTDVVAVDAATRALVARVKVPTTHDAPDGVADGHRRRHRAIARRARRRCQRGRVHRALDDAGDQCAARRRRGAGRRSGTARWLVVAGSAADALRADGARIGGFVCTGVRVCRRARRRIRSRRNRPSDRRRHEALAASSAFGVDRPERESYAVALRARARHRRDERARGQLRRTACARARERRRSTPRSCRGCCAPRE